jgi:hypothetical protein
MVSRNLRAVSGADTYQTEFTGGYGAMEFSYDGANSIATRWIVSNSAQTANTAFTPSYAMTLKGNGNLLLGTTVDSGALLQVGTNTTNSAGGMVFGTDTSFYRTASGNLAVYGTATDSRINFSHSTSTAGKGFDIQLDSLKDAYVWQRENRNLYFGTNNTTALTLDSSQNATFAGRTSAGTAYGTAKSVTIDYTVNSVANTTLTFTVTMPSPSTSSTFLLEVSVYGNSGSGYGSLFVKGGGYVGNSLYYDATELVKVNSGNVTISSVTKANGSMTFTVLNTTQVGVCTVKFSQSSSAAFTTLPTITSA